MKRYPLVTAACAALLLGACAHHAHGPRNVSLNPQVVVVNGRIEVSPEVLTFAPQERNVRITWQLPKDSKARFPDKGIEIEGQLTELPAGTEQRGRAGVGIDRTQSEIVDCRREADGLAFSCLNRHTKSGVFKYTIRLIDDSKPPERDPFICN